MARRVRPHWFPHSMMRAGECREGLKWAEFGGKSSGQYSPCRCGNRQGTRIPNDAPGPLRRREGRSPEMEAQRTLRAVRSCVPSATLASGSRRPRVPVYFLTSGRTLGLGFADVIGATLLLRAEPVHEEPAAITLARGERCFEGRRHIAKPHFRSTPRQLLARSFHLSGFTCAWSAASHREADMTAIAIAISRAFLSNSEGDALKQIVFLCGAGLLVSLLLLAIGLDLSPGLF
jgi:hypothetical protein